MKHLSCCLVLLFLLSLPTIAQTHAPSTDSSAVSDTVRNYIEAYYTGDAAPMQQALHPHYLKHKIHGNIPMREETGPQLVQAVRNGGGTHMAQAERQEEVTVLDISGDIASAKLVTPGWTDYMTLSKIKMSGRFFRWCNG